MCTGINTYIYMTLELEAKTKGERLTEGKAVGGLNVCPGVSWRLGAFELHLEVVPSVSAPD